MLSAHLVLPRTGHYKVALKIFTNLKWKHNARLVFDPTYPKLNLSEFQYNPEWAMFYGQVMEPKPLNAPKERGGTSDCAWKS